ncbi:hypothetical protein [Burkholderia arboris]|uniref:hypothetical protein n=1 Tax=Burkholderia arboris TaxID=488730 RepID=UPI0015837E84|nr:hypothetical protein [Burkholderia arboris]
MNRFDTNETLEWLTGSIPAKSKDGPMLDKRPAHQADRFAIVDAAHCASGMRR